MERFIPEFLQDADNVYRTKYFIVKQIIGIHESEEENNQVVSVDTYYRRTPKRDLAYNMAFQDKVNIDGKRLPSTMYTRTYID